MKIQLCIFFGTVLLVPLVSAFQETKFKRPNRNQNQIENQEDTTLKGTNDRILQFGAKQDTILESIQNLTTLLNSFRDGSSDSSDSDSNNITQVNTSEELHQALQNATEGAVIHLADGVYRGQFELTQSSVTIQGSDDTIIELDLDGTPTAYAPALYINGNNCQIHNVKFISYLNHNIGLYLNGSDNLITNINFAGFSTALQLHNDDNKLFKLSVKNSISGLLIFGNGNVLSDISLQNIHDFGLQLNGNYSQIYSLSCDKCITTLNIRGSDNIINDVSITDSKDPTQFWKVDIVSGSGNVINYLRSDEYCLKLGNDTSNSEIRNGDCPRITVDGTNHTLVNVDAGPHLFFKGEGHRFLESRAELVTQPDEIQVQNTTSSSIVEMEHE